MQLTHYNNRFEQKIFPLIIVCDQVSSPANAGSIFRAADAFGAQKIVFCGVLPTFGSRMQKTSRNTHNTVPFEFVSNIEAYMETLTEDDHCIALEITSESKPIQELVLPKNKTIVLILGAESYGVREEILAQTEQQVHINMYGNNSSMNVAQALTIALYEITNQLAI